MIGDRPATAKDSACAYIVAEGHLGGFMPGGDPATWYPALWRWMQRRFAIASALDVGCAQGYAVGFFRSQGIAAIGLDGSATAIAGSVAPGHLRQHDFSQGPYCLATPVDLVWSCELLEHIAPPLIPAVLATFANASRILAITHAFPGQSGHHHVNCQPSVYWLALLRQAGYRLLLGATLRARFEALAGYRGINHFARSGLIFAPPPAGFDPRAASLERLLQAAASPAPAARTEAGILAAYSYVLRAYARARRAARP